MVSKFLIYPFLLMIVLDIFALGITQNTFGATGTSKFAVGFNSCIKSGQDELSCLQHNYPDCGFNVSCLISHQICNFANSISVCLGLGIGQQLQQNANGGFFTFAANPFTDPTGFVLDIIIVTSVIAIASVAILGTSVLNAGTAYILFIVVTTMMTWSALANAGSSVFLSFPCFNFTTGQLLFTCPNNFGLPVTNGTMFLGSMFQLILSLSVFIGIVDTVAL